MSLSVTNSFLRFVESANAPSTDPLILWLNGGKLRDTKFFLLKLLQALVAPVWVVCCL